MATPPSRPGIMIVNPRLHDPTPENAKMFLRWTKLHNRDLLDMDVSDSEGCEGIKRAMRFSAAVGGDKYGHVSGIESAYFYTLLTPTLSTFKSTPYYALSRRLDLENTRPLHDGEEKVGCVEGMMVWDVVDATFAIFEEIPVPLPLAVSSTNNTSSFQDRTSSPITIGKHHLVGVGINSADENQAQKLCRELTECLSHGGCTLYATLYRNKGLGALPEMHEGIGGDGVGVCGWVVLVLVDGGVEGGEWRGERDGREEVDGRGELEEVVGEWVGGLGGGVEVRFGVWRGELDML